MYLIEMSAFTIPINITDTGRIGSISVEELAQVLQTYSPALEASNVEGGTNIVVTVDSLNGDSIISTVPVPVFEGVDITNGTVTSRLSLLPETPSVVSQSMLTGLPTIPDTAGFITETVGGYTYVLLCTGNTIATSPLTFTPTNTGAIIGISSTPSFTSVDLNNAIVTNTNGVGLTVDYGAGPIPILTENNNDITAGSNITFTTGTGGNTIISVTNPPTFNGIFLGTGGATGLNASNGNLVTGTGGVISTILSTTNTTASGNAIITTSSAGANITVSPTPVFTNVGITSPVGNNTLSTDSSGFLQQTVGGVTYVIPTSSTIGITSVVGSGNITATTTGSAVTVGMTPTPTFTNVTIGTTTVSTNAGTLVTTTGGVSSNILSTSNTTGVSPVSVTPSGTGVAIGIVNDPTFIGKVTIVDNGTTDTAELMVADTAGSGLISSNNISLLNASGTTTIIASGASGNLLASGLTGSTYVTVGTVPITVGLGGQLQETVGGTNGTLLSSTNTTGTNGVLVSTTGGLTTIGLDSAYSPTFNNITANTITGNSANIAGTTSTGAINIGGAMLTSNGPGVLLLSNTEVLSVGNLFPGVASSNVDTLTQQYFIFTITADGTGAYTITGAIPGSLANPGLYTVPINVAIEVDGTGASKHLTISFISHPLANVGRIVDVEPIFTTGGTVGLNLNAIYNASTTNIEVYNLTTATGFASINGLLTAFTTSIQVSVTTL
jgi:hypothetical protein